MKSLQLLLFATVAAVQLTIPAWTIYRQQVTLKDGRVFKFKTAPVDPYDAFRGRYVALAFDVGTPPVTDNFKKGQCVYVALTQDAAGFAKVKAVSARPISGDDVLRARARWASTIGGTLSLDFPFDRYYMEEKAAPNAETAYRSASRRGAQSAWVTIRVRNGYAALEELYIDGKPIREFLQAQP